MQNTSVTFLLDGRRETIDLEDLTALDARDFRQATGKGLIASFQEDADLDTLAGLLWLGRRKRNPKLTYEQVAVSLGYMNIDIAVDGVEADEPGEA